MSLAKEAAEQFQSVIRLLRSDSPMPIEKDETDRAIVKLIQARLRYPDSSPIVRHGRRLLKDMGQ